MNDQGMERLAGELRRWAERPGSLTPNEARSRVLARLTTPRRWPGWPLVAGGGALTAAALALVVTVGRPREPVAEPPPAAASSQRMIVHQLNSGTRLYIVVRPTATNDKS